VRTSLVVLIVLAAAAGFGLRYLRTEPAAPPQRDAPKRLLLVTIDTLRTDSVTALDMPVFTRFLEGATRYTKARTPVPLTLPAHLTMLSGLEPSAHGVHDNAAPRVPVDRGYPLVAEELAAKGFATAAFVSCAVLGRQTGIDAGFQTFEAPPWGPRWSGQAGDLYAERRIEDALAWLSSLSAARPWFMWVHFFDPHDPYEPWTGAGTTSADSAQARYRGEVRRVDAAFGRLLEAVGGDTLVIVASDHGESLGEHDEPTHGNLCYATTMDAVLAVRQPGQRKRDAVTRPVSIAEVAHVLREAGLGKGRPRDDSDGVITGESLLAYRTHGWGQVLCAYDGRYTLIETGPRVELFDRDNDPAERNPIDPSGHPAYQRLDLALGRLRASGSASVNEGVIPDAASPYGTARRPMSGYVSRVTNKALKDPQTGFRFSLEVFQARGLLHMGRPPDLERAVEWLKKLAGEDPTSPQPYYYLAHALAGLQKHGDAVLAARAAIERGYRVAPVLHLMLTEARATEDPKEMRAALEIALAKRIAPDEHCAEAIVELALAMNDAGARDDVVRYLSRVTAGYGLDREFALRLTRRLRGAK
jgi:arylsulfatase A-like enzyme